MTFFRIKNLGKAATNDTSFGNALDQNLSTSISMPNLIKIFHDTVQETEPASLFQNFHLCKALTNDK